MFEKNYEEFAKIREKVNVVLLVFLEADFEEIVGTFHVFWNEKGIELENYKQKDRKKTKEFAAVLCVFYIIYINYNYKKTFLKILIRSTSIIIIYKKELKYIEIFTKTFILYTASFSFLCIIKFDLIGMKTI